jgi:hypothetical protein
MGGYAVAAPTLLIPPPWGEAAWLVGGTVITVGGALGITYLMSKPSATTNTDAKAVPKATECQDCNKKRYTVRVHAQGADCGGTSASTIGAPALTLPTPITVGQGLGLSATTQAMLGKRQLAVRAGVIAKAENYIQTGPASGGRIGQKSFPVFGVAGGIRYDVDCFGDGPSFVS